MCCENEAVKAMATVSDITYLAGAQQWFTWIQLSLSAQRVKVQRTHIKEKKICSNRTEEWTQIYKRENTTY